MPADLHNLLGMAKKILMLTFTIRTLNVRTVHSPSRVFRLAALCTARKNSRSLSVHPCFASSFHFSSSSACIGCSLVAMASIKNIPHTLHSPPNFLVGSLLTRDLLLSISLREWSPLRRTSPRRSVRAHESPASELHSPTCGNAVIGYLG